MGFNDNPFGMNSDDFDRFAREAGENLRNMFSDMLGGQGAAFGAPFTQTRKRPHPEPETAAEAGNGVWAIIGKVGKKAQVEQVFATEIEALRANQQTNDGTRRVRFLPYGIPIDALDDWPTAESEKAEKPAAKKKSTKSDKDK
ncbi:MAG: hypothetical protein QM728_10445 [Gordonia sp. (in: high G+C Gram-positive bacteria)]|uniref:hypothetical protein n=1 Tax=Gordonia sp. (in: high G+C Gram-positive bacteria) TaxID=84139 RepID=UPI0039E4035A